MKISHDSWARSAALRSPAPELRRHHPKRFRVQLLLSQALRCPPLPATGELSVLCDQSREEAFGLNYSPQSSRSGPSEARRSGPAARRRVSVPSSLRIPGGGRGSGPSLWRAASARCAAAPRHGAGCYCSGPPTPGPGGCPRTPLVPPSVLYLPGCSSVQL